MAEYERLWNWAKDKPEEFWAECAKAMHWYKPWTKVLEWKEPFCKWFVGATINASYNCVDRHLAGGGTRPPSSGKASRATRAC